MEEPYYKINYTVWYPEYDSGFNSFIWHTSHEVAVRCALDCKEIAASAGGVYIYNIGCDYLRR